MCGICGWFGTADLSSTSRILTSIRHRGPDDFRVLSWGTHSIGAARLEITGGDEAFQPWCDKQSGLALVFNGEIYNVRELYSELESLGYKLKRNELDVIKCLYIHFGIDFASKLNGMFAIAIIDRDRNRLILTRDRVGIKPLYYTKHYKDVIFASEIKGLLQLEWLIPKIDDDILEETAIFGYIYQQDKTLFKNICQLRPGTSLIIGDNTVIEREYYTAPRAEYNFSCKSNLSYQDAAEMIGLSLRSAVRCQISHDNKEKAFYLSGGVDSSFMVAMAKEQSDSLVAYTLADDNSSEDLNFARKVAHALGIEHHEIITDFDSYIGIVADFIHHYEHIIAGGVFDIHGGLAFHLLSKEISKNFKVAFSGEGADELFGGYYWTYTHPVGFVERLKERARKVTTNGKYMNNLSLLFPEQSSASIYRKRLLDILMQGGLSNYHLCNVDRSCGAFGFEIRPAYLDSAVLDAALSIPIEFKLGDDGMQTKKVLKEAAKPMFEKLGLTDVLSRKKLGMPWSVRNLEGDIHAWAEQKIGDAYFLKHPYRRFFMTKIEICLFDLFYYIFISKRGNLASDFDTNEFFDMKTNEYLYS